ncbi:MAG: DUF4070 domain-containing protein [Spirochaetales bacterium]|nr:DUF4070 domain-containing protein [Spirochaetales bacterium]
MKILLVNPEIPNTFWSYKKALQFIGKKASDPPLAMITVAALLPAAWQKRLIDMNVTQLKARDIEWADYVFIGGMNIQYESFKRVVAQCNEIGTTVVAGGPMCTCSSEEIEGVDHFVLNEAEITLPQFVDDLVAGTPKRVYASNEFPDIRNTPIPLWNLLDMKKYSSMDLQYSRGCPYDCEFCSITAMYGRKPRLKSPDQFVRELDSLYAAGWRGGVFIVDDNFIGNRRVLKEELLPSLIEWAKSHDHPFEYITEASIELSDDEELMGLMVEAGFRMVFVGIETPEEASLEECSKNQNRRRDLLKSVRIMQRRGLNILGGFIVGFDHDGPATFNKQIQFIQQSGITTAMVGILNALPLTRLADRLKHEGRLVDSWNGNNVDSSLNFIPRMGSEALVDGYKSILRTIYSQKAYFERIVTFLKEYRKPEKAGRKVGMREIKAFLRALFHLGLLEKGRWYFWKLMAHVLRNYPGSFPFAMDLAIRGFHYRKVAASIT